MENYITLAPLLCFYGIYFAKQLALKKQGVDTNRLAKGQKPKRTRIIETFLLLATFLTAGIQFASVFFSTYMGSLPLPKIVRLIGVIIALLGVLAFLLAILHMRSNWRAGIDETQETNIVTNGIYKHSRNPAFVGFDLLYIGTALALSNMALLASVLIAITLLHIQILEEEKYLKKAFGAEYTEYKKKTPRYILF